MKFWCPNCRINFDGQVFRTRPLKKGHVLARGVKPLPGNTPYTFHLCEKLHVNKDGIAEKTFCRCFESSEVVSFE